MAGRLQRLFSPNVQQVRSKFTRGADPWNAKTLAQRMEAMNYKNPRLYYKVDIGLPVTRYQRRELVANWSKEVKERRLDKELESKARHRQLNVDLEKARDDWLLSNAPQHLLRIGNHYRIFDDLFEDAFFHPVVPLTIDYDFGDEEKLARVFSGNCIRPYQAAEAPSVHYEAEPDSLWSLVLTTPDCNFTSEELEYCHWFIGNIPGNNISKGQLLVDYMRPIAPRGAGYCRYIFVLYKQDKVLDFSEYKKDQPCFDLVERNWRTYDFYRKYQDHMTPASFAFFQSDYDPSLKDFYHIKLDMPEPSFEYDFPAPVLRKQEWFPIRQPFNVYLDRYRDPKQINKEYLLKILSKEHPFKFREPPLKYPHAIKLPPDMPTWLRHKTHRDNMGWGRMQDFLN